jgi:hypothetical protein
MTDQQTTNADKETKNPSATQQIGAETNQRETNSMDDNQQSSNFQKDDLSLKKTGNELLGQVKEKAVGVLDEQKNKVTSGLSSVADSIRQVGENLRDGNGDGSGQNPIAKTTARYGATLADKIEDFSGYLENVTIKDLTRDVEGFARRQPALFIGGAFLVGVLATRFLKTSAPDNQNGRNSANQ